MVKRKRRKVLIFIVIVVIAVYLVMTYLVDHLRTPDIENMFWNNRITKESSFPTEVYGVPVNTQIIESGTKARSGTKRRIRYIVIHETGNFRVGANAENHAHFLSETNKDSTSWHYTVDDTEIFHHIPDNEIANHAGDRTGNLYGIGIELCVNEDGDFEKTFDHAARLAAYLIEEYDLSIDAIKTHHDFSGKDCPHSILKDDRMGEFIEKVQNIKRNK